MQELLNAYSKHDNWMNIVKAPTLQEAFHCLFDQPTILKNVARIAVNTKRKDQAEFQHDPMNGHKKAKKNDIARILEPELATILATTMREMKDLFFYYQMNTPSYSGLKGNSEVISATLATTMILMMMTMAKKMMTPRKVIKKTLTT